MPFDDKFRDVYEIGIREACERAGAYCERLDEQIFQESMLERIYNQIAKADIVIADMTGRNANVFYEVGYAHALGKVTILLTQEANDIPFDLRHFTHIVYGGSVSALRDELEKRVDWFIKNPPSSLEEAKFGFDLYLEDQMLTSAETIVKLKAAKAKKQDLGPIRLTIHNHSSEIANPGDVKLGVIARQPFCIEAFNATSTVQVHRIPGGEKLYMLEDLTKLYSEAYATRGFRLTVNGIDAATPGSTVRLVVKIFTRAGNREFPLIVRFTDEVT